MSKAGGGNVSHLRRLGLTNAEGASYQDIVSNKPRQINYAICCQKLVLDTSVDNCSKCGLALFWNSNSPSIVKSKIKDYVEEMAYEIRRIQVMRCSAHYSIDHEEVNSFVYHEFWDKGFSVEQLEEQLQKLNVILGHRDE